MWRDSLTRSSRQVWTHRAGSSREAASYAIRAAVFGHPRMLGGPESPSAVRRQTGSCADSKLLAQSHSRHEAGDPLDD